MASRLSLDQSPLIIEDIQNIVEPLPSPADLPVAHLPRRTRNKTNSTTLLMNPEVVVATSPKSPFEWLTRGFSALTNAFIVPPTITR